MYFCENIVLTLISELQHYRLEQNLITRKKDILCF